MAQEREGEFLHGLIASFFSANPNSAFNMADEDFAVADFAGLSRFDNCFNCRGNLTFGKHDFDLDLGKKIDRVLTAAINFRVALLAAETFDFANGHAFDTGSGERFLDLLKLEWFDDGLDFLHGLRWLRGGY